MRYTVLWRRYAEAALSAIWTDAPDRSALAKAANEIDALLQTDPETRGESRFGTVRILVVPPLAVMFDVHEPDRIVWVLGVRRLPPRREQP